MKLIVLVCCVCLAAGAAYGGQEASITVGEKSSLRSVVLGEERPYWVYVPSSYHETKYAPRSYPVLYLLDGNSNFYSAIGTVDVMSSGLSGSIQIPELIVVAVPNTDRTRDFTPTHTVRRPEGDDPSLANSGGGDAFLRFLGDELMPRIDRTYRTKPYRIIVGHSFGGLLAMHAFQSAPDMFQGYVAIDPSVFWDDQVVVRRLAEGSRNGNGRPRTVYLSLSTSYTGGYVGDAAMQLAHELEEDADTGVRSTLQYFPAENHQSVAHIALYHGLRFIFEGYALGVGQMFEQSSTLRAHFDDVSEQVGVALVPPEAFVDRIGHAFLDATQVDKAIDVFLFNAASGRFSANAHISLAKAYAAKGEVERAIGNYEASLVIDPDNQDVREALSDLRDR
jgi:hypothetical protein